MFNATCDAGTELCCIDLHTIATHILTLVGDALDGCLSTTDCAPIQRYVTAGAGDDGVPDSLTVSILGVGPSLPSSPQGHVVQLPLVRSRFLIRLIESGWPTVQTSGTTILTPQPADQNEAGRQWLAHGELLYRTILGARARHQLLPGNLRTTPIGLGDLTPVRPLGGLAGWTVELVVDLPFGGG